MGDFLYGFPPPPLFYLKYKLWNSRADLPLESKLSELRAEVASASGPVFEREKIKSFEGPEPPAPPTESWYSFGVQEKFREEELALDSETLIPPDPGAGGLREHFKRLYAQFVDSLITYLDLVKNMNPDSSSEIKRFVKLYVNLQHILSALWRRQAEEDVVAMLKEQLKRRRKFVDGMKLVLLDVSERLKNRA